MLNSDMFRYIPLSTSCGQRFKTKIFITISVCQHYVYALCNLPKMFYTYRIFLFSFIANIVSWFFRRREGVRSSADHKFSYVFFFDTVSFLVDLCEIHRMLEKICYYNFFFFFTAYVMFDTNTNSNKSFVPEMCLFL